MIRLVKPIEFLWDRGNKEKNWSKHKVTNRECEEAFIDPDKKILKDPIHSNKEDRYIVLAKTKKKRLLFIVFTIRNNSVRIISARDINRKERKLYEKSN